MATTWSSSEGIWKYVSEADFLESVDAMERRRKVAGPLILHHRGPHQIKSNKKMSIKIEQQLTEDLAFIAATEPGARAVAAVTVEEAPQSLTVNIATNSGLLPVSEFANLFRCLADCANGVTSLADSQASVLSQIILMDQSRILSRLRPKFYNQPSWETGSKSPLHETVRVAFKAITNKNLLSAKMLALNNQMQLFVKLARQLDSEQTKPLSDQLLDLLTAAQSVVEEAPLLEYYLMENGIQIPIQSLTTIREFDKFRRYYFISKRLVVLASNREFHDLFKSVNIVNIQKYPSTHVHNRERFVHAEIQLAIYHRLNPPANPPRCIGVSKAACYLCSLFLRQHKKYVSPASHGVLYEKWTVPDLSEYTLKDRNELQHIILAMYRSIQKSRRMVSQHTAFPNQSMIFYTPCISSLSIISSRDIESLPNAAAVEVESLPAKESQSGSQEPGTIDLLPKGNSKSGDEWNALNPCSRTDKGINQMVPKDSTQLYKAQKLTPQLKLGHEEYKPALETRVSGTDNENLPASISQSSMGNTTKTFINVNRQHKRKRRKRRRKRRRRRQHKHEPKYATRQQGLDAIALKLMYLLKRLFCYGH